jgi:hypothetical protein
MHERRGSHEPHTRAVSTHERRFVARWPGGAASSSRPHARREGHVQAAFLGDCGWGCGPAPQLELLVDPRPSPGGFSDFGHFYHQLYPNENTAHTEDPSTITDFNGHIGLAYVEGMGTLTDKMTGAVSHLPYRVDLRFMQGVYVGEDDERHHGAFAAI